MKKILFLILLLIPFNIYALDVPQLHSTKALIYDMTDNNYILDINKDTPTDIASITKILTVITTIENTTNLDKEVVVTSDMYYGLDPELTTAGINVGDIVTIRDLLYAAILPSGADACFILANVISSSEMDFVKLMNEKAEEIGMESSIFSNVTGLDSDNHYSTAEDIKKLIEYSIKNETFKEIFKTREYTLTTGLEIKSTALMFGDYVGLDVDRLTGGKTGYTDMAGLCFAGTFNSNNHEFIIIVLNAPPEIRSAYHIVDVINLINFVDNNYHDEIVFKSNESYKSIKINLSNIDSYNIKLNEDIIKYLPIDYNHDDLSVEYNGLEEINFLTKRNTKLGTIKYYYKDELLKEEDVYLEEQINISIKKIIIKYKFFIIGFITGLLLVIILKRVIKRHK